MDVLNDNNRINDQVIDGREIPETSVLGANRSTYIRFESEYSDEFGLNETPDFTPDVNNTASSLPRYQPELVGIQRHERPKPPIFVTLECCGINISSKTASLFAISINILFHMWFLIKHVKSGGAVYNNWPIKIEFCIEWTSVLIAVLGLMFSRSNLLLQYIFVVMFEVIEELVMLIIQFNAFGEELKLVNSEVTVGDYVWVSLRFALMVTLAVLELYALIRHWRYLKSAYPLRQSLFSEIRNKYSRFG